YREGCHIVSKLLQRFHAIVKAATEVDGYYRGCHIGFCEGCNEALWLMRRLPHRLKADAKAAIKVAGFYKGYNIAKKAATLLKRLYRGYSLDILHKTNPNRGSYEEMLRPLGFEEGPSTGHSTGPSTGPSRGLLRGLLQGLLWGLRGEGQGVFEEKVRGFDRAFYGAFEEKAGGLRGEGRGSSPNSTKFLQNILDLYFKHFKLSEDVVNRILQVVLDLQHFKSSLFIFAATILQSSSAIHHISNIDNYVHQIIKFQSILITSSHSLWSSQSFGHQKGVNAARHQLMMLGIHLLLPVLVNAARHKLTIAVAFLDKPKESKGFEQIIDFLNANPIKYALTVNPTIYTTCIEQLWATAKAKTVNEERQIQALVDKKKVIITETSVRSDLKLEDTEGTECLPNDVIFEQLTLMCAKTTAWNEFSSTMASAFICLATNQKFNFSKYIFDNMVKNLEGRVKFLMYPRYTTKAKAVNGEVHIQALVDGKKVVITKTSVRRALQLKDAEGTEYLPNTTIFKQLTLMGYKNLTQTLTFYKAFFSPQWKFLIHTIMQCLSAKTNAWNEFSSTMASAVICLATNQKFNFSKYIFDNMVKNLEGGVKFLMYLRFVQVFLDKQFEGMIKHKEIYVTPSHTKKVFANIKRGGKGFSGRVTHLFQTMMIQAPEELGEGSKIPTDLDTHPLLFHHQHLNPRRNSLEGNKGRTLKFLNLVILRPMADETENVESVPIHSNDPLLSGEDRLKLNELMELCTKLSERVLNLENTKTSQAAEITKLKKRVKKLERRNKSRTLGLKRLRKGRKIADLDADVEVTLVDEAQGRNDDYLMFDTGVLDEQEVKVEKVVSTAEVTTISATTTTVDELTLAQTLIEIKAAKPKAVITTATTTTTVVTRPKARGVVVQEPTQLNAKLEEEEKLAKQREEDANIAEWDNSVKEQKLYEVQKAFDKTMGWIDLFVSMDSEVVKGELEQERIKKQKIDDDQEEAEMKKHMEIVADEEEIAVDAIPLATKPPIIIDWKIIKEENMGYFLLLVIITAVSDKKA
ncbi:hypothetical protein Tco_0468632, partial [Tanacetum coccineum]